MIRTGLELIIRMVVDIKKGLSVEDVVDSYCTCKTPELRQELIDGIRQIVGNGMIRKAMKQ